MPTHSKETHVICLRVQKSESKQNTEKTAEEISVTIGCRHPTRETQNPRRIYKTQN